MKSVSQNPSPVEVMRKKSVLFHFNENVDTCLIFKHPMDQKRLKSPFGLTKSMFIA